MERIYWGEYTTNEMGGFLKEDPVVLLPVGAYEQHGPHLAMNTDTVIVQRLCEETVKRAIFPCVMLPAVWIGISPHHMKFTGSLTLRYSTMSAIIYDILDGLAKSGVRKVLAVNGHGGNMTPLSEALAEAAARYGGTFALLTYWNLITDEVLKQRKSGFGGISHAGEMETSLQLYLDGCNVRPDKIPPANNRKGNKFWSPAMFARNKVSLYVPYDELSEFGHVGDPACATREFGEAVFHTVLDGMLELCGTIYKGGLKDEDH